MSSIDDDRDDSIDKEDDLEGVVDELQENLDRLEEMVGENVAGLHARISKLEDRLDRLDHRIDSIESQAKAAAASSSPKKEGKIEKALDVLGVADKKVGGAKGVKMDTGDVVGAAECSRSRARGLMDEMAGAIEGAATNTPKGPIPKNLKLPIGERGKEALEEELLEAWGGTDE